MRLQHNTFALGLAWATTAQGWALAITGYEDGLGTLLHGLASTRATGARIHDTFTLALLADIYLRHKRIDEGLDAIAEAQKLVVTGGELFWHVELLRLKGELLLRQSDHSVQAAEECFRQALKIAHDQHAKMLELEPPRAWRNSGGNSINWTRPNASWILCTPDSMQASAIST